MSELITKVIIGLVSIFLYRFMVSKKFNEIFDYASFDQSFQQGIFASFQNIIASLVSLTLFFPIGLNKNNEPVVSSVDTVSRVVERAKCRNVMVEDEEVKIKFLNAEDAELFAGDLKNLLNNKGE